MAIKGEELLAGKKLFYKLEELPKSDESKTVLIVGSSDNAKKDAEALQSQGHKTITIPSLEKIEPMGDFVLACSGNQCFKADFVLVFSD